jgi:hypothetical protein
MCLWQVPHQNTEYFTLHQHRWMHCHIWYNDGPDSKAGNVGSVDFISSCDMFPNWPKRTISNLLVCSSPRDRPCSQAIGNSPGVQPESVPLRGQCAGRLYTAAAEAKQLWSPVAPQGFSWLKGKLWGIPRWRL